MNIRRTGGVVALAIFVAAAPVALAKDKGKQKGKGKQKQRSDESRRISTDDRVELDRIFGQLDRNRDGVISRAEWPHELSLFQQLDRNRDNVLTRAELIDARNRDRDDYDDRDYYDGRENMRFKGMDTNGDGVITRREWRGNDRSFRNHDRNGDGVLSGSEVRPGGRKRN